ncbi:conserved hypothetical protein [Flavobacterium sp. 9AF]|uniref:hypothetical protein n=1 Tax=Flavobacterium sp. 9AF TaxID=2653142 RepID=UPI0012F3765E|nr:hypothetical protein [Flavobacterium sp. 9AF]VXB56715.1 conserved hypothetical protein [Flavobacterium sp. 9AF]
MYTNHEIGEILHRAKTIEDFLFIQIEILENIDCYLKQFKIDYFNFIGAYCMKAIPHLLLQIGENLNKLACFHFLTTLFFDFERFYKIGGACYFKISVASIEDKLKSTITN